jgi:hypothetical protein
MWPGSEKFVVSLFSLLTNYEQNVCWWSVSKREFERVRGVLLPLVAFFSMKRPRREWPVLYEMRARQKSKLCNNISKVYGSNQAGNCGLWRRRRVP